MSDASPTATSAGAADQPSFQIEKVYVKDLSLEIPHAPQIFLEQVQPQLEVQIKTGAAQFAEGYYEVTVTATVTAKVRRAHAVPRRGGAGRHLLGCATSRSQELDPLLGIGCPTMLFPYLRETHLGPHHARRLSAGAARAGVVRGALHAAPPAGRRATRGRIAGSKSPR